MCLFKDIQQQLQNYRKPAMGEVFCDKCEHHGLGGICHFGKKCKKTPIKEIFEYPNHCSILNKDNCCPHFVHKGYCDY